ncbi:spermatogenesis-associated protein 31E1-like isoform X1 [Zalophus californianus]|uniref:Spermatogenesis-associated protein 31E1-like isoform X1 n=1 Tax=Zalophus californianus TaxID=9704 RepID=A0A6P9EX26_ZALCA|nr:spermatogenesis-associated protein 31E1-like isoform X1 [Zalophus californianus]
MQNYLFPQKSITGGWLSSSASSWALNIILAFLCGLGLLFLLLSYFQPNPSLPPCKKHRNIRKPPRVLSSQYQAEPWRRNNRSKKKNQTLKACRDCLQELEEVQDLFSLLQSHLARVSDQGRFQLLHRAAPGQVRRGVPAGAHEPCREPMEDAPTVAPSPSPAPRTGHPLPLASTRPEDQTNLKEIPLDTVRKSLPPGNSYLASLISTISGLGHAIYPILSFSWWWKCTKSLFLPSSLQHKCQQEHVSCHAPETSLWGGLTNKHIETHNPSFVNPDVQKLLEILITKRVELKIWKEKEKGGSVVKQWCPDDHVGFLGTMWKLLGAEQNTTTPQSFWNMKDKPEPLAGSQLFSSPKVLEDHLQQKCSQLFWGLPSLHSESLMATALVSTHSSQLQVPSVLFNGISNCLPVLIQDQISSQFSHAPPLLHLGTQPRPSMLSFPWSQAPLPPSVPTRPPSLPSQRRTGGVSCPTSQKKTQFIPTEIQHLERSLLLKQQERGKTLPTMVKRSPKSFSQVPPKLPEDNQASQAHRSVSTFHGDFIIFKIQKQHLQRRLSGNKQQGSLRHRIQLSLELMRPQDEFPWVSQAQIEQGLSRPFVFKGKSSQVTQRTRSRYPRSSHRKRQARFQLEKNFSKGLWQCLKRTPRDLSRVSARYPVKVLGTNSEKELVRPLISTLKSDPGKYFARGPDKKHLEKILKVHLLRKLGQINRGLIPLSVRRSWFVANHALPEFHPHTEIRNLAPLKDRKPCVNTSHELFFLSPHIRQKLEAHILRFRARRRWDPPLQASKPMIPSLCEAQHLPYSQPPFPCSGTFVSRAHSKAKFYRFLGKPPQPHPGGEGIAEESVPASGGPLPFPSPACEEIQQGLGGTSPDDGHESLETSLSGQKGGSPSQTSTLSLINRTLQSKTVMGAKKDNLDPSQSLAMARNELKEESGGHASPNKVAILEMNLWSQSPRAKGAMEAMEAEKAPAWKVILTPSMLANNQTIYVDLRRSGSPSTSKSPSPPTESVAQDPKEPSLKTKASKFELQEEVESGNQPQGHTAGVLLQDSPSDILLPDFATGVPVQDCDTSVLLKDLHTNARLAEDILTTHKSPCSQREHDNGDTPASLVPHDLIPCSEGHQESSVPEVEEPRESQRESDSTNEREDQKSPKPEKHEEESAEPMGIRASQASGTGHPPQVRGTGESLGSKYLQLMPEKGQIFPESHVRKGMRNFLQCLNRNKKGTGLEDTLQKGKAASALAWVPVRSKLAIDSKSVEAQTIVTAVGQILGKKMGLHRGICASEINQHKELQAPVCGHSCYHRVLSSPGQGRVMRETAFSQQATPKGHSCPNRNEWIRHRNSRWEVLPRDLGSPGRCSQHRPMVAGVSGHIQHYPTCHLRKFVSPHQAVCASHIFPDRKVFLQEKIGYMQRKPIVSHVGTSFVC